MNGNNRPPAPSASPDGGVTGVYANKDQITCIQTLISKLQLRAQKETIIEGATSGRTTSTRQLYFDEVKGLVRSLKAMEPTHKKSELMRRKIISMAHEMSWRIPGTTKADMKRIDAWMVKSSYLHKKLNQYLYAELPKLVTQFEKVYNSFLKGL